MACCCSMTTRRFLSSSFRVANLGNGNALRTIGGAPHGGQIKGFGFRGHR